MCSAQGDGRRTAIVVDHPAQHFVSGYRLLGEDANVDLQVLYWDNLSDGYMDHEFNREVTWDIDLISGYSSWSPSSNGSVVRSLQCALRLLRFRPQVIICYGWATRISRIAILYAFLARVPVLYYGDATWQHSGRPRLRSLRATFLRFLFTRKRAGGISTGTFNREFYIFHGMRPDRIHEGVCPVDTSPFIEAACNRSRPESEEQVGTEVTIAFAGKFIERKAPSHLIQAVRSLATDHPWTVTMIGDGALRSDLEQLVQSSELAHRVRFVGFKNTSEMPEMLAAVDILVISSTRDMRVLVTTEAMAAGVVPVVSSATAVWGAGDLVEHGVTGLVYPAGDIRALSNALAGLIEDPKRRAALSSAARARALEHDSDDFARLAAAAVTSVVRGEVLGGPE